MRCAETIPCLVARRHAARAALTLGALAAAATLVGCGGGGKRPPPPPPAAAVQAADEGPDPVLERWELLGENPRFAPLRELYERYTAGQIEELSNPMMPNLVAFVEKPVIERRPDEVGSDGAIVPAPAPGEAVAEGAEQDPRTAKELKDFSLIILMTGVARPKAVVVDSQGNRYTLERGDPLGSEGGRVKAVLQYALHVAVPGQADPVVLSLEPPLHHLGSHAQGEREF